MRKLIVFLGFLVCMSLSLPASAAQNPGNPAGKQKQAAPAAKNAKGGEKDPLLHDAMKHLVTAKDLLEKNPKTDYEGHRKQAIQSIDEAMHQLAQAIEAGKEGPH